MAGCATSRPAPIYESPVVELRLGEAQISEEAVMLTKTDSIEFLRQPGKSDAEVESELVAISVLMGCNFNRDISLLHAGAAACASRLTTDLASAYLASYHDKIQPKITKKTKGIPTLPYKNFIDYVKWNHELYYYAADALAADVGGWATQSHAWMSSLEPQSQPRLADFADATSTAQFEFAAEHILRILYSPSAADKTAVGKRDSLGLGIAMTSHLTAARELLSGALSSRERGLKYVEWVIRTFRRYQIHARVEVVMSQPYDSITKNDSKWPIGLLMFELVVSERAGSTLIPLGVHRIDSASSSQTHLTYVYHLESEAQNEVTPSNIGGLLLSDEVHLRYYQIGTLNEGLQTTPKYIED
jgi:hypothetical protein